LGPTLLILFHVWRCWKYCEYRDVNRAKDECRSVHFSVNNEPRQTRTDLKFVIKDNELQMGWQLSNPKHFCDKWINLLCNSKAYAQIEDREHHECAGFRRCARLLWLNCTRTWVASFSKHMARYRRIFVSMPNGSHGSCKSWLFSISTWG
jgi:hypothetical protein